MYSKREWDVSVVTDSGIYKNLRIEGYYTQKDAEAAALSQTGAKRVAFCVPAAPSFASEDFDDNSQVVEVHHYYKEPEEDDEDYYKSLDDQEIEMYDLMCQIAMEKGEELPTISEFYEWLENSD
jgi:hypothetical protein